MLNDVQILRDTPEAVCDQAFDIYLDAFWPKLKMPLTDRERAARVLRPGLRPDRAFVAVKDDEVLGIAGFHEDGGFLDPGWDDLRSVYGILGGAWRALVLSLYERKPAKGEFLMDGIAVSAKARGQGVGTALLNAIEALAREKAAKLIRLDVIEGNDGARRLYERFGFVPLETERFDWLRPVLGFSASTRMQKDLMEERS